MREIRKAEGFFFKKDLIKINDKTITLFEIELAQYQDIL